MAQQPKSSSTSVVLASDHDALTLGTGEGHLGEVGGRQVTVGVELTRPADTTAYAALDAVSDSTSAPTVLTFAAMARVNAGSGYIVKARLMTDQSTNVTQFRLHLFNVSPTPINDNAAYTLLYANAVSRVGEIDFPALKTEGSGSTAANGTLTPGTGNVPLAFVAAAGSQALYGLLETRGVFTPASAQKFYVFLTVEQN